MRTSLTQTQTESAYNQRFHYRKVESGRFVHLFKRDKTMMEPSKEFDVPAVQVLQLHGYNIRSRLMMLRPQLGALDKR